MPDLLLDVQGLETQFKTPEGVIYAVNGVSFGLKEGETLGVVGESGCGKSVSMLSVLRLIASPPGKITAGKAYYRGQDLLQMSNEEIRHVRGAQIAMIFQDPMTSLNPVLTVEYQLTEPLLLHLGMNKEQARVRAIELLEMVGIPNAKERLADYPHQFSGGMRQRVMIAMALACNPQILIADEPTTALDVTIQAQIIELVKRLRDELGMTIIWITHDLGIVAGLAQRVIVMYGGFIIEEAFVKNCTSTQNIHIPLAYWAACHASMSRNASVYSRLMACRLSCITNQRPVHLPRAVNGPWIAAGRKILSWKQLARIIAWRAG